jgi:hypothetical protein
MNFPDITARVARLHQFAVRLGREVAVWKDQQSPLLPLERR